MERVHLKVAIPDEDLECRINEVSREEEKKNDRVAERTTDQSLSPSDHSRLATHGLICADSDGSLFTLLSLNLWRIQCFIARNCWSWRWRTRKGERVVAFSSSSSLSAFRCFNKRWEADSKINPFLFSTNTTLSEIWTQLDQIGHPVPPRKESESISALRLYLVALNSLSRCHLLPPRSVIDYYSHLVNQASQRVIREVSHSEPSISLHISTAKLFSTTDPIPRPKCRYRLSTHNPNPFLIY